ncbi:hypothetical protein [Reichenbachiella versicolor]|uniref:hypothetical protein n=1 Tax=Reichenbachiella versicolor TaxID=1821036 RepID=UPI000D6E7594|nr:hypothetical protein [Reichenbachiella versicolor]
MKKGVLYVGTGKRYVEEALVSYRSVRSIHPDLEAIIWTDIENVTLASTLFNNVKVIENPVFNFLDKIEPLLNTTFDKTLFMDTDTYLNESIEGLWELLDTYDIAFTFDNGRINDKLETVPNWFSEVSTGVLLYNNTEVNQELFSEWRKEYVSMKEREGIVFDQTSFRQVLWENKSKINFFLLPNEFNFYTFSNNITAKGYPVKIFHGRFHDFKKAASYLNSDNPTLYVNDLRFLEVDNLKSFNYIQTQSFLFRLFLIGWNYFYRILHKFNLSSNSTYKKKKGNA